MEQFRAMTEAAAIAKPAAPVAEIVPPCSPRLQDGLRQRASRSFSLAARDSRDRCRDPRVSA